MKNYILFIGLMIAVNFASSGLSTDPNDPVRSKTYSKNFPLAGKDKVNLNNSYGDIQIKTWNKNEFRVDIDIKAYSKDEADAQRLIDGTVIEAGKSGDQVSVKTIFAADGGKYGSKVKNGKIWWRREVRVNYIVYMPAANALTLSNQYGNVNMGTFSGALNAKVQYGSFSATGSLGTLNLEAQYSGVTIGTVKGDAMVKLQYGPGLDIGKTDNLELDAQYANVKLGMVTGVANIKQQYNRLHIGSVNKLNLKGQYTTVTIGNLQGEGNFSVAYNKLTVDQIGTGCKNLNLVSSYSKVAIGFSSNYHGDFELRASYSPFKAGPGVSSKLLEERANLKNYGGTIGNGGTAKITIKAEYGVVNLN
jgi:hypothetical protein